MDPLDDEPAPADDAPEAHPGGAQQDGGPRADEEPLSAIRQRHQRARRRRALAISGALVVVLVIGVLVYPRLSAKPPTGAQESGYENTQSVPGAPALGPDLDVLWRVPAPPSGDGAVNARILPVDNLLVFVAKETAQGDIWVAALVPERDSARQPPSLLWASTIKDPEGLGDAPITAYTSFLEWRDVWQNPQDPRESKVFIKDWAVDAGTGAVERAPWADPDAATPAHAVGTFNETVVACGADCSGWTYSSDSGWTAAWTQNAVRIPHSYRQAEAEKNPKDKNWPHTWILLDPDQDGALPILDTATGEVRTPFPTGTSPDDVYAEKHGWTVVEEDSATVTSYSADGNRTQVGTLAPDARSAVPLDDSHYHNLTGMSGPEDPVARVTGEDCDSLTIGRPSDDPPAVRVPAPTRIATRTGDSCVPAFALSSPLRSGAHKPVVALAERGGTDPAFLVLAAMRTDERPDGPRLLFPQDGSPPMVFAGTGSSTFLIGVDENGLIGFVPKVEKK